MDGSASIRRVCDVCEGGELVVGPLLLCVEFADGGLEFGLSGMDLGDLLRVGVDLGIRQAVAGLFQFTFGLGDAAFDLLDFPFEAILVLATFPVPFSFFLGLGFLLRRGHGRGGSGLFRGRLFRGRGRIPLVKLFLPEQVVVVVADEAFKVSIFDLDLTMVSNFI